jgi:hypothetical protein
MENVIYTGKELIKVKNEIGYVIMSELDKNTYMLRTELLGHITSFILMDKYAAQVLGITHEKITIAELEKRGEL